MQPVQGMFVKSLITSPAAGAILAPERSELPGLRGGRGRHHPGRVSTDNGRTWSVARLSADRAPYAWREFEHLWRSAQTGSMSSCPALLIPAVGSSPSSRIRTPRAISGTPSTRCASMWRAPRTCIRLGIAIWFLMAASTWLVSVPVHGQSAERLPPGTGLDVVRARCLSCHGSDLIEQQRLPRGGWDREIDKMIGWGAAVQESERGALTGYLADHFGPSVRSESIAPGILAARSSKHGASAATTGG